MSKLLNELSESPDLICGSRKRIAKLEEL
jgi:hypothetical protein